MMGEQEELKEIVIYDAPGRKIEVQVRSESLWLSLTQVAILFGVNKPAISKHLKNIYASGELDKQATVSKMETVQTEGGRTVRRQIEMYNLDAVISVGYRVNSALATQFRIWATGVLREHLTRGLTINRQRLEENAREIEAALELVRRTMASPQLTTDMGRGLVEVITRYTQTFLWLQRYDEGNGNGRRLATQQSVDQAVKSICDIMRRGNCAGAMQYVPELTWILFLRILDEKEHREEQESEALGVSFRPSLESPFRWRDWATPPETLLERQTNKRVELQNSPQNA